MSASSKKKLRSGQASAKLTEKQLAAKKEEQKVRLYTIAFVVVLVVLLVVAVVSGISQKITSSGLRERKTIAMTVGSHEISNAELSYYYIDSINTFYSQNGAYASLYGLDVTKPLDEQQIGSDGSTWADNFLDSAKSTARAVYTLADDAAANGFTLPAEQESQVDTVVDNMGLYATMYGYNSTEAYLKAMYGNGATVKDFREYYRTNLLADAYQTNYENSLTYTDEQIRAYEAGKEDQYNSYNYNQYFLSASEYLTGGTVTDSGTTDYSAEERAAAAAKAEEIAKTLVDDSITSVEDLDKAIAAATDGGASTAYTNQLKTAVNSKISDWVSDPSRKAGDKTYIPSTYTSTEEDGSEVTNISGYYVVYFRSSTDNSFPLVNVRHILAQYEGGTTDENGTTVYSDEEKAAAMAEAEAILNEWKSGAATEDSFAALAAEKTDDSGSKDNGGLYEDVYPGQMVEAFNDWCFDASRKAGDTGIVETSYGCHVMYFSGNGDISYRDYLITNDLRESDFSEWYNNLVNASQIVEGDTSYIRTNIVLGGGNS